MPLQKQMVRIPFTTGLQESVQEELLDPGQGFITSKNVDQDKRGAFQKRRGFKQQTKERQDTTIRTKGVSLFSLNGQTCVYDGSRLDSYGESSLNAVLCGKRRNFSAESVQIPSQASSVPVNSVQILDGYGVVRGGGCLVFSQLFAKEEIGFALTFTWLLSIVDETTGVMMREYELEVSSPQCKVAIAGNYAIAFYSDVDNPTNIYARDFFLPAVANSITTWNGPFTVATDFDGQCFDVSSLTDLGSAQTLAYLSYSSGSNIVTNKMSNRSTIVTTATIPTSSPVYSIGIGGDSSVGLFLVYSNTIGGVRGYALNPVTLAPTLSEVNIYGTGGALPKGRIGVVLRDATHFAVVFENVEYEPAPSKTNHSVLYKVECTGSGSITTDGVEPIAGYVPISKPFILGGRLLCQCSYVDMSIAEPGDTVLHANKQRTEVVLDLGDLNEKASIACNANMRLSSWANFTYGHRFSLGLVSVSGSIATIPTYLLKNAVSQAAGAVRIRVDGTQETPQPHFDGIHLPGATPFVFDGQWMVEDGWCVAPEIAVTTVNDADPQLIGQFNYTAIFERTDANGNVWWSAPSTVVTIGGDDNPIPPGEHPYISAQAYDACNLLNCPNGTYRVVLYRTTNKGTVFYRVGAIEAAPGAIRLVFFSDFMTDEILKSQQQLYTQPGTLGTSQPRQAPPFFSCETVHMDRVFGANGKTIFYSAVAVEGEGTWFSDAFQFIVERGGGITGLCSQDGHLYVFKEDSIFYVDGQGPPENGGNGTEFSSPIELPAEVGCINARSIVRTQDGVMFQSTRGIEVLTRAQSVEWIGEPVRDKVSSNPVITSAVLDEETCRAIFTMAPSESDAGPTPGILLIYNLNTRTWSTSEVVLGETSQAYACGAIVPNYDDNNRPIYAFVASDGFVLNETRDSFYDVDLSNVKTFVPMTVETPNVKMAGLQGFQRIWRVQLEGVRESPHDLSISIATDYEVGYPQSRTWVWDEIETFKKEQIEVHVKQQKSRALRIKIQDSPPTGGELEGDGKTITLFGLALTWGQKMGTDKLPAVQRG